MPRLTGNSSQGSKPTTRFSFTLSWMPHCTPQNEQCVFTSRSGCAAASQPPAGASAGCGPYSSMRDERSAGSLAIALDSFDGYALRASQPPPPAARAEVEVELVPRLPKGGLQVLEVRRP